MKDARLTARIFRRNPYYNYIITIRSTPMAKPKCPGSFERCLVNGRTAYASSGTRTKASGNVVYPTGGKGVAADQRVYIGLQADVTPNDGYYIKYSVCRKGSNGAWFGGNGANCPRQGKF